LLLALLLSFRSSARAETTHEYQIKAGYLLNFARFTEWPPEALGNKDAPLVIGILGTDPFGNYLDEVVRDEVVRGRRLVVQRYQRLDEIKTCHILFLGHSESERLEETLDGLKGKPVLTVCDIEGAATRAVTIRLVNERNRVRFLINVDAAKAAKLTISSKLLQAAIEIVGSHKK